MFDPFPDEKLKKILIKINKKNGNKNYIIAFNPPKILKENSNFKLINTILRNTYSAMIFQIK